MGEQLGKPGLGTVNPKAEMKLLELIGRKLNRVGDFAFCRKSIDPGAEARISKEQGIGSLLAERHHGQSQQEAR